MNGVIK